MNAGMVGVAWVAVESAKGSERFWELIGTPDDWFPASAGTEEPFTTRVGRRLQYVFNPYQQRHAYYDLDQDRVLDDSEIAAAKGDV